MKALLDWLTIGGMSAGLFLLLLCINAVLNRLDRLPRPQEPRNAPRTRQMPYRPPAAAEEPER